MYDIYQQSALGVKKCKVNNQNRLLLIAGNTAQLIKGVYISVRMSK